MQLLEQILGCFVIMTMLELVFQEIVHQLNMLQVSGKVLHVVVNPIGPGSLLTYLQKVNL